MIFNYPFTEMHELNLDWFLAKFKELVEEWNQVQGEWTSLHDYVQNYFDNLNVQNEIDHKLDALVADGTLATIMEPYIDHVLPSVVDGKLPAVVANQIGSVVALQIGAVVEQKLPAAVAGEVSEWLAAHVDPDSGYVIDDTLTIQGTAADSKVVGDILSFIENYIFYKGSVVSPSRIANGYRYDSIGQSSATRDDDYHVQFIPVTDNAYYIHAESDSFCAFSTDDSTVNTFNPSYQGFDGMVAKPSNANYFVISKKITDNNTCVKIVNSYISDIITDITDIESSVNDIESSVSTNYKKIFAVKTADIEVGWIKNDGTEMSSGNYHRTAYIPIKNGESFDYKLSHGITQPIIAFYNTNKVYDGSKSVIGIDGYSEGTYTATANGFVRMVYLDVRSDVYAEFYSAIPDNVRLYVRNNLVGTQNILLMGDSIFGNDGEIASDLNTRFKSCINGAFGGTRVTDRGGSNNFRYFDGENIIDALCTQVWTDQDAAAAALESSYPWITGRLAALKAVDMSTIDCIIMDWGTNDYTASVSLNDIKTAYESVIDMLQSAYPALHIVITTPIWRYFNSTENGDNKIFNDATLKEISDGIEKTSKDKRITVFNAYENIPLSYATASTYYDIGDNTHLNSVGNHVYANYLSGIIRFIFGE